MACQVFGFVERLIYWIIKQIKHCLHINKKYFYCVRITITVAIIRETVRLHQQHEHDKEKASLHV